MTPEFARLPVHKRAAAMIALASRTCGVSQETLAMVEPDWRALHLRRLAAWLMRDRAKIPTLDVAAFLGVEAQFVHESCFTVRSRLARRGIRIDAPLADLAAIAANVLLPLPGELARHHVEPAECLAAVAQAFGLSRAILTSDGRARQAAWARFCFCWLASIATQAGPKAIGRCINRERTTANHGIAAIYALPGSYALLSDIMTMLDAGRPDSAALLDIGQRLELLSRDARRPQPQPQPKGLNP